MNLRHLAVAFAATATAAHSAEPVTVENFKRAETHFYMAERAKAGCFGKLCHERTARAVDDQAVVRLNRDTLYSAGVFDLSTPLTFTMPQPKGRFQSVLVVNEDHYNPLLTYGPTTVTLTKEMAGSRYVQLAFRTFFDPNDPKDIKAAHTLQDAIQIRQASPGSFEIPEWDAKQREALRDGLKALAKFSPEPSGRFGTKAEVDPVRHLIGTAAGWGGNPLEGAVYISRNEPRNDGTVPYVLRVGDVPVDGFWSVTVYNEKGFYEAPETAVSVNNVTAKRDADNRISIHFGGDPKAANYLRIMPGWNYVVRLYRPRKAASDGSWSFPEAQPLR